MGGTQRSAPRFYERVIAAAKKYEIEPFATLEPIQEVWIQEQ
jgi:beta-glucosidase/6-phospho-beta-glucosidase/beta-galactosidase